MNKITSGSVLGVSTDSTFTRLANCTDLKPYQTDDTILVTDGSCLVTEFDFEVGSEVLLYQIINKLINLLSSESKGKLW